MARGKKEKLSLEELVEQAVVKEEEQPYEVPSNWVWTRLGNLAQVKGGKRLPKGHTLVEEKTQYPYVRVTDFGECTINIEGLKYINKETQELIKNYVISNEDVYISIAGTIGKVGIIPVEIDGANLTENAAKITKLMGIDKRYLMYLLKSQQLQYQINSSTLATTQAKLALFRIAEFNIPLPPLAEQQRIVDRIESLFEKLDTAKELVQNALDSFENRKAAILHKAFTGELTAKWREENGVNLDSWEEKSLKEVCNKITDGTHKSPQNYETGDYMYVTAKNIKEKGIDLTNITYITKADHEEIYARCNVQAGDVLYIKDGATTGIATINTIEEEFSLLSSVALLKVNKSILNAKYLVYNMNSPITKSKMINNMSGNAITRLTLTKIKEAKIVIPSLEEQQYIVDILDSIMNHEQQAQELCNVIEKIDLMKKSILARAFRGELGTNDPEEESAMELLKKVLKEKL